MESETAQPQKCSCKCHKHAVAIFAILLVAGVACWYIHHPNRPRAEPTIDPKPGTVCTVHFRQDAFVLRDGKGTSLPIVNVNTTTVAFHGTLIAANREAILFEANSKRFWIPKSSILLIEYYAQ